MQEIVERYRGKTTPKGHELRVDEDPNEATLWSFGQKIQTYYFCSAYRSSLSEVKIVQAHADMQARDLMEVSIVTEHCESVLQRVGRDPHVVGRNGTTTASEFPIHSRILCCRLRVDHQLV